MNKIAYYGVDYSDEDLTHYGVMGMKWGLRKARHYERVGKRVAKRYVRAAGGNTKMAKEDYIRRKNISRAVLKTAAVVNQVSDMSLGAAAGAVIAMGTGNPILGVAAATGVSMGALIPNYVAYRGIVAIKENKSKATTEALDKIIKENRNKN